MPKNKVNNNIKLKSGGGLVNSSADGLSVDTAYILANSGHLSSLIAGENITAYDAVAVGFADRYLLIDGSGNTGNPDKAFADSSTYFAQSFTTGARDKTVHSINFLISSTEGSGTTRTFTVSLRADDAGKPHSTVLGTGTCTYTKVSNISDYSVNFSFASPVSVSPLTKYWIVISINASNYVTLKSRNVGTGASVSYDAGTNWSSAGTNGYDTSISVYTVDTEAGKLYQCSALYPNSRTIGFVGFATESKTAGNSTAFQVNNVFSNLTGLTAGIPYYLSDTYGAISSSPGTNSKKVGLSLSATSLLIKNDN